MKRIINIIIDFSKKHTKPLVIFTSALISLSVICGIFVYNNGVQNKKEKELLSRIDNLEEQIKKEEGLSEKDESDTNSADSSSKEPETDNTDINSKEEVETQNNNTTTNKTGSTDTLTPSPGTSSSSSIGGMDKIGSESNEGDKCVGEGSNEKTDGIVENISDNVHTGFSCGNSHYAYDVDFVSQRRNYSDYVITNCNYSDNEVYLNNNQFDRIEGTLSVTVRCLSDTTNITVKYVIKDDSGSIITDGECETLTAQSSGKGNVCTLTGIVYVPLTQEQGSYTIEFID